MYVCRRLRLFTFLQERGFQFISTMKDKDNPNFMVWLFAKTPALVEAVEEYYATVPTK